jgi:uncharacterized membrane protein
VAVRFADGSVTLDGKPFVRAELPRRRSLARFFASLALGAPPLCSAAVGELLGATGGSASDEVGINEEFVREVGRVMKPGSSAMFVLDQEGDMAAILEGIHGLGGTVLKTSVSVERAKLIQSTLNEG